MKRLGSFLALLRTQAGFSMREAAKKAGVAAGYLSKLEAGNTFQTISIQSLSKLANVYASPVSYLLEEAGYIERGDQKLPELPQYLRLKYRLSHQAIRDMELTYDLVRHKYKN